MSSEPDCIHVLKDASQLTLSQKQRKQRCTILPITDELHPWADPIGGRAWTRLLRNPALHIAKENKDVARKQRACRFSDPGETYRETENPRCSLPSCSGVIRLRGRCRLIGRGGALAPV